MIGQLASALRYNECAAEEWLQLPFGGVWNFDVSSKGMRLCPPGCQLCVSGKTRRETPGCYGRKKHVVMVVSRVTLLACRLRVADGEE